MRLWLDELLLYQPLSANNYLCDRQNHGGIEGRGKKKEQTITQGHYLLFHVQDQLNHKTEDSSTKQNEEMSICPSAFLGQISIKGSHHTSLLVRIK